MAHRNPDGYGRAMARDATDDLLDVLLVGHANVHDALGELREAALQNHSLADEAIEQLAGTLPQALAELVVINQTRLLRRTSLLVALEANPIRTRSMTGFKWITSILLNAS